ncbi:MAG: response regulator transcription factor [Bacteroidales bacterium]|nr:response regulator transcription factor [Bacteroidales bacterium]
MDKKIKIILVDDHKMFREGLSFLISKLKTAEVIAEAENGQQFLQLLKTCEPDIVLMDINMPQMDGIEATEIAVAQNPDLKVVALSMNGDENYYYKMISAGAKGFVLKQAGSEELEEAIETVMAGNDFFSPELMKNIIINMGKTKISEKISGSVKIKLTDREQETLELICHGLSTKEIGDKLFISPRTVEGHKARIMEKLGATNTSNLIIQAIKNKLIDI